MKRIVYLTKKVLRQVLLEQLYRRVDDYYFYTLHPAYKALPDMWFHLRGGTLTKRLIIVIGASHRVGSTWLYRMVQDLAHCQLGREQLPTELTEFGLILLKPAAYKYLWKLRGHKIFKSHSLPPTSKEEASSAIFISIYRDPRDVFTSLCFYLAYLDEKKGGKGEAFRQLPPRERIKRLLAEPQYIVELEQWFRTPFVFKVRYEELKKEPVDVLLAIANFIGISTTPQAIEQIVQKHDFEAMSGRKPGQAKEDDKMRKGVVGDWRNYFDQSCIHAFKTEQEGRCNRLLVEMGYEKSLEWE